MSSTMLWIVVAVVVAVVVIGLAVLYGGGDGGTPTGPGGY
jgi:hypothetical protein